MAYEAIYHAHWVTKNIEGTLYIEQLDYSGGSTELRTRAGSLNVNYNFKNFEDGVIGLQAQFIIVNNFDDFFELMPLMYAEEREYRVHIEIDDPIAYAGINLFEGFINSDTVAQKYLHKQELQIVASGYINKLDFQYPTSIDTLQYKTFIDVIDEILRSTGSNFNIRVNSSLYAAGDTFSEDSDGNNLQTLFNKNGFYTELFWKDEIERATSLEILKTILLSFCSYIYWYDGYWYIERYDDIWKTSVEYVEYTTGVTYNPSAEGVLVTVSRAVNNVHSWIPTEQTQTITVNPGFKKISLKLNDKKLENLIVSDFSKATATSTTPPEPANRCIEYWDSVAESGSSDDWCTYYLPGINYWDKGYVYTPGISSGINRTSATVPDILDIDLYKGLYTTFRLTADKYSVLNITFKTAPGGIYDPGYTSRFVWDVSAGETQYSNLTYQFHWYLRDATEDKYFLHNPAEDGPPYVADNWSIETATEETALQTEEIAGTEVDIATGLLEVSFNIPLKEARYPGLINGEYSGDKTLVLCLGIEKVIWKKDTDEEFITASRNIIYGDLVVAVSVENQPNVIDGDYTTTKFLNKKEIGVDLYDINDYNYSNGVFRGTNLEYRTDYWMTDGNDIPIKERGVVYATHTIPTLEDYKVTDVNPPEYGSYTCKMESLSGGTTYHVRAYCIDVGFNVTYGDEKDFTTDSIAVSDPYIGGVVAYILEVGDPGYDAGEAHGIIADVADLEVGAIKWWNGSATYTLATATALMAGSGVLTTGNTYKICANQGNGSYAAKACKNSTEWDYQDWCLPTKDDLNKLYLNRASIGGFTTDDYWSSTENGAAQAWCQDFSDGSQDSETKDLTKKVRAIRYF